MTPACSDPTGFSVGPATGNQIPAAGSAVSRSSMPRKRWNGMPSTARTRLSNMLSDGTGAPLVVDPEPRTPAPRPARSAGGGGAQPVGEPDAAEKGAGAGQQRALPEPGAVVADHRVGEDGPVVAVRLQAPTDQVLEGELL